jgi:hypothetical protein
LLAVGWLDDELEHRHDRVVLGNAPQQSRCPVGAEELLGHADKLSLAARVLHWPVEDNIVSDQFLPLVAMGVKSRVVALDYVLCMCLHVCVDLGDRQTPSVLPASCARGAAIAAEELAFGIGLLRRQSQAAAEGHSTKTSSPPACFTVSAAMANATKTSFAPTVWASMRRARRRRPASVRLLPVSP